MKDYQTLLIALDLTGMDQVMMRYARFLVGTLSDIERVIFHHNIRFDYPDEAESLMKELDRPLSDLIGEEIEERIGEHFFEEDDDSVNWELVITQDNATAQEITRLANSQKVDLVLVGKKLSYSGSGLIAEKLLRQQAFKADLIALPETAPHRLGRVLVPTDFSAASKRALLTAQCIVESTDGALSCQHVYTIPMHYFPCMPVQGFRKSMEEEAEEQYEKFRKSLPGELREVPCNFTYSEDRSIAQSVYDFAIQKNKDLVVLGSKGRSNIPAMLLGSTAIQLLKFEFHIPILIVR